MGASAQDLGLAGLAVRRAFLGLGHAVARYTRLDCELPDEFPPPPAMLVLNHGFGGLCDLNALAFIDVLTRLGLDEAAPLTVLAHEMVWTLGLGPYLEPAGLRRASKTAAGEAFEQGRYLLVLPGGDIDAAKPWPERNQVKFGGRSGFARTAMEAGVPVVPTVIVGAGESLVVLSDGQRLARRIGLDRLMRQRTAPVTLSVPWGLSVGVAGLGYLPLPTKLRSATGPAMAPNDGETPEEFADRVQAWMQAKADEMTRGRVPLLGWQLPATTG